jgi:hypothetical protein
MQHCYAQFRLEISKGGKVKSFRPRIASGVTDPESGNSPVWESYVLPKAVEHPFLYALIITGRATMGACIPAQRFCLTKKNTC